MLTPETNTRLAHHRFLIRRALAAAGLAALAGCSADARVIAQPEIGNTNYSLTATVGQEVAITLANVGPGQYASPPTLSSAAVTFLSVDVVPPNNPSGPTQRFRFRAVRAGQTVIVFNRLRGGDMVSVVEDTIQVQ